MNKGIWYATGAYSFWGLFPIYFKWLQHVPALQIVGHRIFWSFVILLAIVLHGSPWARFRTNALNLRTLRLYTSAAILISVNWLVYVWAVNAGRIVEASLGYFIAPLVNVLLGVLFLRERLRRWQWVAIALAGAGVLFLALSYGVLPWISLTLAFSFGTYGLVKKTSPLGSVSGLTMETGVLLLAALPYLLYCESTGHGAFLHTDAATRVLLIGAGVITMIPLLMFASATQRIPLSLLGVLQYITPTLQFLLGVLVYREPFTQAQLIGFGMVWAALAIFSVEGYLSIARRRLTSPNKHPACLRFALLRCCAAPKCSA